MKKLTVAQEKLIETKLEQWRKKKRDIEVAIEGLITGFSLKCNTEDAISSRVLADEIVDVVLKMLYNEKVEVKKPWQYFAVGKPK